MITILKYLKFYIDIKFKGVKKCFCPGNRNSVKPALLPLFTKEFDAHKASNRKYERLRITPTRH